VSAAPSAAPPAAARIVVAGPYLELHTGPGRGYPVFHVAASGEPVELLLRQTDWYRVRTGRGIEGWVSGRALRGEGAQEVADSRERPFELGGAFGRFKGEPMLKLTAGWRFGSALAVEATAGQVQGLFSGTDFWHLNLAAEPWQHQRLSAALGVGFGGFRNLPNTSLVGRATTQTALANVNLTLRWQLAPRVLLRADVSLLNAYLDQRRTGEYRAVSGGLSFTY
jgi:uncharacterized protein YgiM (DUF1202 family)